MSATTTDAALLAAYTAVWEDTPGNPLTIASVLRSCRAMLAAPSLEDAVDATMWWVGAVATPSQRARHVRRVEAFLGRVH